MQPSRPTTASAVIGLMTLATVMSLGALSHPAGLVVGVNYASPNQGLRWTGPTDDDTTDWIGCLTRVAQWMRGTPHLPPSLSAVALLPGVATLDLPCQAGGWLAVGVDHLPHAGVTLQPHLIDLPPPALA